MNLTEVRAHDELELWPKSDDPALLHPMSPRLVQILETYKRMYKETGKEQPFLKNARYVSIRPRNTSQLKQGLVSSPRKKRWRQESWDASLRPSLTKF